MKLGTSGRKLKVVGVMLDGGWNGKKANGRQKRERTEMENVCYVSRPAIALDTIEIAARGVVAGVQPPISKSPCRVCRGRALTLQAERVSDSLVFVCSLPEGAAGTGRLPVSANESAEDVDVFMNK